MAKENRTRAEMLEDALKMDLIVRKNFYPQFITDPEFFPELEEQIAELREKVKEQIVKNYVEDMLIGAVLTSADHPENMHGIELDLNQIQLIYRVSAMDGKSYVTYNAETIWPQPGE